MTLQLPLSTRQLLVNTLADLMDTGTGSTGSVQFETTGGQPVGLIDAGADTTPPVVPFFQDADNGQPTTAAAMTVSDIEDSNNTVAGEIAWASFRNLSGDEQWRSDVGPSGTDIIMANTTAAPGDPIRLSTYQVQAQQDN